jgi:aminoglycoside phosphotransferase (APT) family kinase protein
MSASELEKEKQARIQLITSPESDIEQIIYAACDSSIRYKERITVGYSNEVYAVTTQSGQEVIVRIHWYNSPYFENEKWALQRLASEGLAVPQTLYVAHHLPGDIPHSVCVQNRLAGESLEGIIASGGLTDSELRPRLFDLGRLLRKVHAVSMTGFGQINPNGHGAVSTWRQAYVEQLPTERAYRAAFHVGLHPDVVRESLELLAQCAELGDSVTPCLLHGDFQLQNVLVLDGQITGLIDFEFCESGDAAKEVPLGHRDSGGWSWFFGRQPIPSQWIVDGYFDGRPMDKTFEKRMMWFKLANSLNGLAYHGVNDKDNPRFMDFLRQQFPRELRKVREYFSR